MGIDICFIKRYLQCNTYPNGTAFLLKPCKMNRVACPLNKKEGNLCY